MEFVVAWPAHSQPVVYTNTSVKLEATIGTNNCNGDIKCDPTFDPLNFDTRRLIPRAVHLQTV